MSDIPPGDGDGGGRDRIIPAEDLYDIILNMGALVEPFMYLITAAAYLCGIWLMALAVAQFKKVADYRSMMYHPVEFKGPIMQLVVGISLIYLPTIFKAVTHTAWGTLDIMRYDDPPYDSNEFDDVIAVCFNVLKLIGVFGFLRGLFILSKVGAGNTQQGGVAKALIHMGGGVVAYHLYAFLVLVEATLGIEIFP